MQQKWCSMSQYFTGSQGKCVLQHLRVLQSLYNVTSNIYESHVARQNKFIARQKLLLTWCFNLLYDIIFMLASYPPQLVTRHSSSGYDVKIKFSLTLSPWKPMFYYVLNIKMTSKSLSNFCIKLRATGEWICEVRWWLWRHFYVQNVVEHRFSWNKCFLIYPTNAEKMMQHVAILHR